MLKMTYKPRKKFNKFAKMKVPKVDCDVPQNKNLKHLVVAMHNTSAKCWD
jgi:hypothetical protein